MSFLKASYIIADISYFMRNICTITIIPSLCYIEENFKQAMIPVSYHYALLCIMVYVVYLSSLVEQSGGLPILPDHTLNEGDKGCPATNVGI